MLVWCADDATGNDGNLGWEPAAGTDLINLNSIENALNKTQYMPRIAMRPRSEVKLRLCDEVQRALSGSGRIDKWLHTGKRENEYGEQAPPRSLSSARLMN